MARIGDFLGAMSMEQFFGQSPLESHINGGRGALIKVKFLTVTLTLQRKYTHKKLMHSKRRRKGITINKETTR